MDSDQLVISHCVFDTAIGTCGVAWSSHGLVAVQLPARDRAATERRLIARTRSSGAATPPAAIAALIADITRYLAGERVDFSAVPVDLSSLDPFRRKLYETMLVWETDPSLRLTKISEAVLREKRRRVCNPRRLVSFVHSLPSQIESGQICY